MSRVQTLRLVVWLTARSLRVSRAEVLVRAGVAAVAVVLVLIGSALGPTAHARSERVAEAMVPLTAHQPDAASAQAVLVDDSWQGRPVRAVLVATDGRDLSWRGRPLPGVGELVLSPELERELAGSATLAERYPGKKVGTISADLLVGPHQLVVWRGVRTDELPADAGWIRAGGGAPEDIRTAVPGELQYAYPLLAVGFVVPLFGLMALLSSLGAARREQRLAALRLVGLQDRDAKLSAALEDGAVAVLGCLGGLLLFPVLVRLTSSRVPVWGGLWSSDVSVSWMVAGPLLVAFPVVAVGAGYVGLRGLTTSPLGVERRTSSRPLSRLRLLPLLLGAGILALARPPVIVDSEVRAPFVIAAIGLVMVGLAGSVPLLVAGVARVARGRSGSVAVLIAASRTVTHPRAVARVAVGLTCMVVVAGPLLVFFPLIGEVGASSYRTLASSVGDETLVVVDDGGDASWGAVASSPEVRSMLQVQAVTVRGAGGETAILGVVDCRALHALVDTDPARCRQGLLSTSARHPLPSGDVRVLTRDELPDGRERERATGAAFRVARQAQTDPVVGILDGAASLGFDALVSEDALPVDLGSIPGASFSRLTLVLPEAGRTEEARTAVVRATGASALTASEQYEVASRTTRDFTLLTAVAAALILCTAGLSTLASATDEVRSTRLERRLLQVGGAPRSLLTRTLVVTMLAPVLVGVVPAVVLTLVSAASFLSLAAYFTAPLPVAGVLAAAVVAVMAPAVATLVVVALARRDTDLTARV